MTAEERDALRELASRFEGKDSEGTTTTGFPVDGEVLGVDLGGYEAVLIPMGFSGDSIVRGGTGWMEVFRGEDGP